MCQANQRYGDGEPIPRAKPEETSVASRTGMAPGLRLIDGSAGRGGRMFRTKPLPKFPTTPPPARPTTDPSIPKDPLSIFRRRYAPTKIAVRSDVNIPT